MSPTVVLEALVFMASMLAGVGFSLTGLGLIQRAEHNLLPRHADAWRANYRRPVVRPSEPEVPAHPSVEARRARWRSGGWDASWRGA